MSKKFKKVNPENYTYLDHPGVTNTGMSLTVPDQALSIREIMTRYVHGMPLSIQNNEAIYEEDDVPTSGIHPRTLDLTDLQAIKQEVTDTIDTYRDSQAKQAKAKADKEAKDKLKAELAAESELEHESTPKSKSKES